MEFPHLGEHCSNPECKQLDFLPMKCDACQNTFCKDHLHYENHTCSESYKKNNQVPVCPLCNSPCPNTKGERPDVVIGRHIDNDCMSDSAAQRRKIYTNKCSLKSCKQKELVPMKCEKCQLNYCIRHRNELDHDCKGFQGSGRSVSNAGAAAINRNHQSAPSTSASSPGTRRPPQQQPLAGLGRQLDQDRRNRQQGGSGAMHANIMPGHMTEEEAIQAALAMSLGNPAQQHNPSQSNSQMSQQEQEDLMLAQALAASEEEARRQNARRPTNARQQEKSSCEIS